MGLVGAHSISTGKAHEPTELFITVSFDQAETFARALAEATARAVHLLAFHVVPWAHPHHLCVRWLNVIQIPTRDCPRGAVMRWKIKRDQLTYEAVVRLESLLHFRAVDGPVTQPAGEFMRVIGAPALGGFLI